VEDGNTGKNSLKKRKATSIFYSLCNKSSEGTNVEMKGERAESNALGHSSCGRCPHPDIVTILCTSEKQWIVKNTCQTKSSPYQNHTLD